MFFNLFWALALSIEPKYLFFSKDNKLKKKLKQWYTKRNGKITMFIWYFLIKSSNNVTIGLYGAGKSKIWWTNILKSKHATFWHTSKDVFILYYMTFFILNSFFVLDFKTTKQSLRWNSSIYKEFLVLFVNSRITKQIKINIIFLIN